MSANIDRLIEIKGLSQTEKFEFARRLDEEAIPKKLNNGYLRTRHALINCQGSLSNDIIKERNDRI